MKKFSYILLLIIILSSSIYSDDYEDLRSQGRAVLLSHEHDILKSFIGNYRQIYSFSPPDGKPEKGFGNSNNGIILNERYLEIVSKLDFKNEMVTKKTIIGFDRISNKYILTEYSNIENFPLEATGYFSPEKKSLIFEGKYPHTELNSNSFRMVYQYDSLDRYTYYFYEYNDKKEDKILEVKNFRID